MCIKCKKHNVDKEFEKDKLCNVCLIKKRGLPWMANMKLRHTFTGQIGYAMIGNKEFLIVSGSGGMLFSKEEAMKAEERFRGERALTQ
jgi:hypothetical protein